MSAPPTRATGGDHDAASTRSPCCAPDAKHEAAPEPSVAIAPGAGDRLADDMVLIGRGAFMIGSDDRWAYPADGEGPVREISLDSFWIVGFRCVRDS